MKPADWAWLSIAAGVISYEAVAAKKDWDYLSEAMDKYRKNHPWVIYGCIGYLSAHLTRIIPRSLDPLHVVTQKIR
jgi:hypothetical protein